MAKSAFVDLVTADQPDAPAYFTYDAVLNTKERPTLEDTLARELTGLTIAEVLAKRAGGLQIVDTRDFNEFASVHLAGSLNVPLGGSYATTAGMLLSPDAPIVLITEPGKEHESAMRLGRVGLDRVIGYSRAAWPRSPTAPTCWPRPSASAHRSPPSVSPRTRRRWSWTCGRRASATRRPSAAASACL